jgi:uncharacterized protein with PIN domain
VVAVTGFNFFDEQGLRVLADIHGNNAAFRCPGCGGPVLAILREHQRGVSPNNPSECPSCASEYWVEVDEVSRRLTLHRLS